MKLKILVSLSAAALLCVSTAANAQGVGKIHGHVTDPTGAAETEGTVSLTQDSGGTLKYSFPISPAGDYAGSGIVPGTYAVVLRQPNTPPGKEVDEIDNVKIAAGDDVHVDVDMSRPEYLSKLTADQRKQIEDFKKKNAEILKSNQTVKALNTDLADARTANHDKKYDVAETLMTKDTGLKPDSEILWYELGNAQMGLKKWDDAVTSFQKAIDLSTAHKPNPELIGGAHAAIGEADGRNNKPDAAVAEFDAAANANPAKKGFYYSNETVVFSQVGNADLQAASADKAIAADPQNALDYYLKGQALISKATVDAKTGTYVLPPGCAEAYQKYLDLAPTGQFANDVKAILAQSQTKVENKFKAKKS